MLPRLLRQPDIDIDSDTFYRDLSDLLLQDIQAECPHTRMRAAAIDLDSYYSYRSSTAGSRIMEQIFYGISRGEISPQYADEDVSISIDQFMASIADPQFPLPDISELTARLKDARYLIKTGDNSWSFSRATWGLHQSLAVI
jgi:hypothetical protein